MKETELLEAARSAKEQAYCPYSNFAVGAALRTPQGIYVGCNIENASYGATVCAERVAFWKALSEGQREFHEMLLVVDYREAVPPCGMCLQVISEFCSQKFKIFLASSDGNIEEKKLSDLLPKAFSAHALPHRN